MGMAKDHFVLVHGEGHGGWCWFKLRWLLEGSGYRVTCIDLAGGGVDPTDPNTVRTFEQYDKPLLDLISTLPEGEKVILMGHGIGGLSVIHAMHEFVDRVKQAIFVAAAMLPFGLQTDEDKKDGLPSLPDNEIKSTFGAGADDPPTTVALRLEFQRDRLSQQSPEEDSILTSMLMRPWPVSAIGTASFEGDDERLNRVKRVFIKTERDHMLDPQQQDSMIKKWPPSEVLVIDTDHSPFFSLNLWGSNSDQCLCIYQLDMVPCYSKNINGWIHLAPSNILILPILQNNSMDLVL